ncbi:Zinc finger, CCHC domain-containing protein [Mortierella sp. AD031]|nr:Zinc finger, CCHC domain-containing protein [Mortierella sp. AD031]KAG0198622.1 Zinc finger, CCHC domain-containing protein [Mortierella sp. NVP41]
MPIPDQEHYDFVDLLFERLLFERVNARNHMAGCCISPGALSMQLDLIGHYYTSIALTKFQCLCGKAIQNRDFSNWGILSFLSNHQNLDRFKLFPNSLAAKFNLEIESDKELKQCEHIFCPWMSHKQSKDFKKDYMSKVPKDYQREFEFLVDMLDQNGLLSNFSCDNEPGDFSWQDEHIRTDEIPARHVDKLLATRPSIEARVQKEAYLLHALKTITALEPILLSSSAKGINISDCDVEVVMVTPESAEAVDLVSLISGELNNNNDSSTSTKAGKKSPSKSGRASGAENSKLMTERMVALLKKAGYKSVQQLDRYFDPSCNINVDYVAFVDPKTELTCKVTLDHPLGIHVRNMLQDYANIDSRVEPLVFVIQQTLDDFGRCRQYLSNYAVALMTIAFLQTKKILPLLQSHLIQSSGASQSLGTASTSTYGTQPPDTPKALHGSAQSGQQESSLLITKSQIKSQKRKNKKRLQRERAISAATVQVKIFSGGTRSVDCRYDRALAQTRPFDNRTLKESVAELLADFMDYFGFRHKSVQHEVSVITGTTTLPVAAQDSAYGLESTLGISAKEKRCLVVRDPFVVDRNVTWLCSQWRLAHCERLFVRVVMYLDGSDQSSDEEDEDDEEEEDANDEEDEDEDGESMEEIYGGYRSGDDDEDDVFSDGETYPILVHDLVDRLAALRMLALLVHTHPYGLPQ